MSYSVGSVSSVNFRGSEMFERPGKYSAQHVAQNPQVPAKSGSTTKKVVGVVGTLVAIAAALVGLTKGKLVEKLGADALKDAGIMKKAGHYLATAGEYISKYTWDQVAKLFTKAA